MNDGVIEGFEQRRLPGDGIEVAALVAGSGPPLLLLHGYPQTRMCWAKIAPRLAERFTVVVPDLRGYGRTDKPEGGGDHRAYSKRTMARDQVALMRALGFDRFAVAGHDRGGRIAYRLALDHPEAVTELAVLDIVPTGDVWAAVNAEKAIKMWHMTFMVEETLPERMIGGDPEFFLRWMLQKHAQEGFAFDPAAMDDYLTCGSSPEAIHGMCEDYRAAWAVDGGLDDADRGERKVAAPLLLLWGDQGAIATSDPLGKWRSWADNVQGHAVPGGHFLPEEASDEVLEAFKDFFH
jgi:haloacetate dehalogenase